MDWFLVFIIYLTLGIFLSIEARNREIGSWKAFLVSMLLTPVIGTLIVFFSPKKITFHHYIKVDHDKANKQTFEKGADQWIELKA